MEMPKQKAEYQPSKEEQKDIEESIEEHNKGVRENRKNTSEVFSDDSNKKNFENLSNDTQEFLANIYDNVAIGFINRIDKMRVARSNRLYSFYKNKTEKIENELEFKKRSIEQIKADMDAHDLRMTKMSEQFGGLTPKAGREALKERNKFKKALEKAESEKLELLLEGANSENKRNKFEEKRNEIIERIEKFVEKKIEPHKEKIKELNENNKKLDKIIYDFKNEQSVFGDRLNKLKEEVSVLEKSKSGMFKSERITYTAKMKEAEKGIKNMDKLINSVQKEKNKNDSIINKLETKVDYWNRVAETAKTDNMPEQEQTSNDSEEKIAPEEEAKETENPGDNKAWYEAVMPSEEKIDEHNKTKEWYEANRLSEKDMENVIVAESQEKKQNINVGDKVLWENQGILQWKEPKIIKSIQEDPVSKKMYALFEGEVTGAPIDELILSAESNVQENNIEEKFDEKFDDVNIENEKNTEENLDNKEIYPSEYINKWNSLFGNRLFGGGIKLDDEKILNILEMPNGINELPLKRMEEAIVEYNSSKGFFSRVSDDELKRMFKLIRDAESLNK